MCVRESESSHPKPQNHPSSNNNHRRQPEAVENDGDWERVKRRSRQHTTNNNSRHHTINNDITTYFVYNLPPSLTSTELKQLFQAHGNLCDAYIAKKRDKYNNPFGFIRFRNILNPSRFLTTLQNKKTNGMILGVFLSKTDKQGNPIQTNHSSNNHHPPHKPPSNPPTHPTHRTANYYTGRSYRDTLVKTAATNSITITLPSQKPKSPSYLEKTSIIATVKDLNTLQSLSSILQQTNPNTNVSIHYVGGLSILFSFKASAIARNFLKDKT